MRARVLIIRAAGTNCDEETAHAWRLAGAETQTVHVKQLLAQPDLLCGFQVLTLPGGFSYGDDIAAGTILAAQLMRSVGEELTRFIEAGKLILGICNGFQVLVKAGLLPDPRTRERSVTLAFNASGRFEARWVGLQVGETRCRFLTPGRALELPVAHAEGRVVCRDEGVLQGLVDRGHVALRYVTPPECPGAYPDNPNGSVADIAGLTDATGQILGLMPHPERFVHSTQHPLWTRRSGTAPSAAARVADGEPDGLRMFKTALAGC